jgi:hypothetical protein
MAHVVVSVEYGGHLRRDLALPLNVPVRLLAEVAAQALNQPEKPYILMRKTDDGLRRLPPNASLGDAGVFCGAMLALQEEKSHAPAPGQGAFLSMETGDVFPLTAASTIIGRPDPKNGILVDLDLVPFDVRKIISRRHASIQHRGEEYFVQDEGSVNGTYLNGRRLPPRQEVKLTDGDMLEFGQVSRGGVQMTFINKS